jgi:hypothetical protein
MLRSFWRGLGSSWNNNFFGMEILKKYLQVFLNFEQGDQIGRIFASLDRFLMNFISRTNTSLCINFDQKWVGLHFGRFFYKLIWSP